MLYCDEYKQGNYKSKFEFIFIMYVKTGLEYYPSRSVMVIPNKFWLKITGSSP